jgi:hypothetical protein
MRWLKQSTSVDLPIGPFLDITDGASPETALTITQPDIRLKKNGGAWAQKNAAQTLSHEENGFYEVTLDATDTNALGCLRLAVFEAGALPVFEDFMVVPANVWDSLFASDFLQVDVVQAAGTAWASGAITAASIANDAITAPKIAADAITSTKIADNAITAAKIATDAITSAKIQDDALTAAKFATDFLTSDGLAASAVSELSGSSDVFVLRQNTAQGGTLSSITLDASASSTNDNYNLNIVFITSGTGAGQSRQAEDYDGTTKVLTVAPDWVVAPDNTSVFVIAPFGADAASLENIEDSVWNALRADHQIAGTFGENVLADAIKISGDATSADTLESYTDGTTTAPANITKINGVTIVGDGDATPFNVA